MSGQLNWAWPGYAAAYSWLARDVLPNLELILALLHEPLAHITLSGPSDSLQGVLLHAGHPLTHGLCYRIDALDAAAVADLVEQSTQRDDPWLVHRPWQRRLLGEEYGWQATGTAFFGYATQVASPLVPAGRRLTEDDELLMRASACGWSFGDVQRMLRYGREPWAIVKDEQIVCRASAGYATPWTEEVLGVWTHPEYRAQGLARHLVAAVANAIIQRKPWATYTTTGENVPSQHVALAAGFTEVGATYEYLRPPQCRDVAWNDAGLESR